MIDQAPIVGRDTIGPYRARMQPPAAPRAWRNWLATEGCVFAAGLLIGIGGTAATIIFGA